jgi:hypothetical protein
MKIIAIVLHLIVALPISLFSQTEPSVKWSLSLSGGMAVPLSAYGKNDPEGSAIIHPEVQTPRIIGFQKSRSGFAKKGHYYNAELKLSLPNRIHFFLRSGQFVNPVTTAELSRFLTEKSRLQEVEHVDYEIFYFTPGIGYTKLFKNWVIGVGIFTGFAQSGYPYYKSILLYTTTDPPLIWGHDGERPRLNGLTYGGLLQIDYNITSHWTIGIESTFQKADFDYSMTTRIIPGFTPNPDFMTRLRLLY